MKRFLLTFALISFSASFAQSYQFLGSYTSDGTPLYFTTSDVITSETLSLISNSLPENYPVPTYNPQYISSGYDTDVILDSNADVWVTFVSEGAGYKNVLGFYTYDSNNPPTTAPTASEITIVFPNVSGQGSGGSLIAGNKVKIGTFPAGTGIGWVLLANAWNGSKVTNGLWRLFSNPNFNPEANASLRQHNVLLNDPTNQRVILGFEDIRRDYGSCDNDFNDAVFYVTSNPYEAMRSSNFADVSSATDVSSANNGGLESKGDLASLIAKRNFNRTKNNSFADTKSRQNHYKASNTNLFKASAQLNFSSIIPTTGMFGNETSYVSSPTDLTGITNAQQVYSVDYYKGDTRVAAILATETQNEVYGHSKAICDRLNSSTLEDIRTVTLNGYEIIMVKLKRESGAIEYALNFSVQQLGNENKLYSYWNIAQYPVGDYLNFQVWGSSMGQVCGITNSVITKFQEIGTLTSSKANNQIPYVFVKKGTYKNGKLFLTVSNKSKATSLAFNGNKKATELSSLESIAQNINLTGALEQEVSIDLGGMFDIGFSIKGNNSSQLDALYLADGPWGLDYLTTETRIDKFVIQNNVTQTISDLTYPIERNVAVSGQVYGTLNMFRNVLPGELTFDASNYSSVGFKMQNSLPVEVVLVTENMTDWDNRLRFQLPAQDSNTVINISLADFSNALGDKYNNQKIKGFVFSVKGNYTNFQAFSITVADLILENKTTLSTVAFEYNSVKNMYSYPNPCQKTTTLVLPSQTESATVQIFDMTGKMVQDKDYKSNPIRNEVPVVLDNLQKGMYLFIVTTNENKQYQSKCSIE